MRTLKNFIANKLCEMRLSSVFLLFFHIFFDANVQLLPIAEESKQHSD